MIMGHWYQHIDILQNIANDVIGNYDMNSKEKCSKQGHNPNFIIYTCIPYWDIKKDSWIIPCEYECRECGETFK